MVTLNLNGHVCGLRVVIIVMILEAQNYPDSCIPCGDIAQW